MPAPGSPLHIDEVDGVTVVTFRDRILLDTEELKIIERELLELAAARRGLRLVIDFENVRSLSSQMLGALLKVGQAIKANRGELGLCNLASRIREAFQITNLQKAFHIFDNQPAAVRSVR